MILRIADLFLEVLCECELAKSLPNLIPFLMDVPLREKDELITRLETACSLNSEIGMPMLTTVLEGRTLSVWLKPHTCSVQLTFHHSNHSFLLQTDRRWRHVKTNWTPLQENASVALNDFIMLSFIYSAAFHQTVLFHASSVSIGNKGCAFVGPSGIGKSTHSQLWIKNISGTRLLNDDQPILRLLPDGSIRIYGSPWSGKTPCYQNRGVELEALFFMEQANANKITKLDVIESYHRLLQATSLISNDTESFAAISETQARVISMVPAFKLENLPVKAAAELSYQTFISLKHRY